MARESARRLLKNCENRCYARGSEKALTVFTGTYRATTAREWNDFEFFNKLPDESRGPIEHETPSHEILADPKNGVAE
jgi:hypothetical protein